MVTTQATTMFWATYWTSVTDHRHGTVDPAQRRGEAFRAKRDGLELHADAHASHTVAVWLLPQPLAKALRPFTM